MNIFGMNFGGAKPSVAAPTPAPQPNTAAAPTGATPAEGGANPNNPNGMPQNNATTPNGNSAPVQKSPVDQLNELLNTAATPTEDPTKAFFQLDTGKVQEIAKSLNFSTGIPPELMQAAAGGDFQAQQQIQTLQMQAMFAQMMPVMSGMAQKAGEVYSNQLRSELPKSVARDQVQQHIAAEYPTMVPIADAVLKNLQAKNPNMNQAQLKDASDQIMQGFINQVLQVHSPQAKPNNDQPKAADWDGFFGLKQRA